MNKQKPLAAVIGLGLIGGSAAKCLAKEYQVIGYDPNHFFLQTALQEGVLQEGYYDPNSRLADCTIIYLAAPVQACCNILQTLPQLVTPKTIVTDLCSTKQEIISCAIQNKLRFVGGHPMAGSEQSGYTASHTRLMENAYYLVVPSNTEDHQAINLVCQIANKLFRAIPLILSPQQHDMAVGLISHLPHVVSASLVNLVRQQDTPDHLLQKIAAGGFRDITRISSSDPSLWNGICISNCRVLSGLLEQMANDLTLFSQQLRENHPVTSLFQSAKEYRDEIEGGLKNEQGYELKMDVEDRPGVIGQIATLLGAKGINITNINISNSREFEGGVLRVRVKYQEDVARAIKLLQQQGYYAKTNEKEGTVQ